MAYALRDSTFCFYHDPRPEIVAKRRKALMKGAKKTNTHDGLETWTPRPITTMQELKDALSELFNAGMGGEITTARLSALASVANALGKVIEGSDLEKRIEEFLRFFKSCQRASDRGLGPGEKDRGSGDQGRGDESMSLTERSYRLCCIALEAELERLKNETKENDITPIVIEVLEKFPGAQAELLRRLEETGHSDQYRTEPPELAAISDDELERRARAILERRDLERAEGKP